MGAIAPVPSVAEIGANSPRDAGMTRADFCRVGWGDPGRQVDRACEAFHTKINGVLVRQHTRVTPRAAASTGNRVIGGHIPRLPEVLGHPRARKSRLRWSGNGPRSLKTRTGHQVDRPDRDCPKGWPRNRGRPNRNAIRYLSGNRRDDVARGSASVRASQARAAHSVIGIGSCGWRPGIEMHS